MRAVRPDCRGLLPKTKRPKLFRVGTFAEQPSPEVCSEDIMPTLAFERLFKIAQHRKYFHRSRRESITVAKSPLHSNRSGGMGVVRRSFQGLRLSAPSSSPRSALTICSLRSQGGRMRPPLHNQYGPMIPPIWRVAGFGFAGCAGEGARATFSVASRTSRYFRPVPVLKRTTVSSSLKNPFFRSLR